MPSYLWKNTKTGKIVEVFRSIAKAHEGPDEPGTWQRIYSFGVGRVEGGASKGRASK